MLWLALVGGVNPGGIRHVGVHTFFRNPLLCCAFSMIFHGGVLSIRMRGPRNKTTCFVRATRSPGFLFTTLSPSTAASLAGNWWSPTLLSAADYSVALLTLPPDVILADVFIRAIVCVEHVFTPTPLACIFVPFANVI